MFATIRLAAVTVAAGLAAGSAVAQEASPARAPAGNQAPAAEKPSWPIVPPPTIDGVDRAARRREAESEPPAPPLTAPPIPREARRPAFNDSMSGWGDPSHRWSRTDLYENPEDSFGYRNPGGVGRFSEYYPPGDQFQNPTRGRRQAATYGIGMPTRSEQLASYNAGTARYNALQRHIDRYGSPRIGWGWGFGFGAGAGLPF